MTDPTQMDHHRPLAYEASQARCWTIGALIPLAGLLLFMPPIALIFAQFPEYGALPAIIYIFSIWLGLIVAKICWHIFSKHHFQPEKSHQQTYL